MIPRCSSQVPLHSPWLETLLGERLCYRTRGGPWWQCSGQVTHPVSGAEEVVDSDQALGPLSPQMAIVFNQEGLSAIQLPCVVQNFINHNAVLYKVFVVGESYTVVQRPSLKNFSAGTSGN